MSPRQQQQQRRMVLLSGEEKESSLSRRWLSASACNFTNQTAAPHPRASRLASLGCGWAYGFFDVPGWFLWATMLNIHGDRGMSWLMSRCPAALISQDLLSVARRIGSQEQWFPNCVPRNPEDLQEKPNGNVLGPSPHVHQSIPAFTASSQCSRQVFVLFCFVLF